MLCFTLYLRAISKHKPPGGDSTEGFCVTSFGGLYLEGLIYTWRGLFYGIDHKLIKSWSGIDLTIVGILSKNVFERCTSTGSEPFSLLICLNATKFVFLSVFPLINMICPKIWSTSRPKFGISPHPVDVRRSKTALLKKQRRFHFRFVYRKWRFFALLSRDFEQSFDQTVL